MKVLKSILAIYVGMLIGSAILGFILFPLYFVNRYDDPYYYYLFLINVPIFLGVLFNYMDNESIYERPKK